MLCLQLQLLKQSLHKKESFNYFVTDKPPSLPPSFPKWRFLKLYPSCLGVCSSICQLGSDYFYCIFTNMLVLPKLSSTDMAEESWWSLRINPQSEAFGRRWEFRSCSYMHWWSVRVTALTHVCWPNSCNNLRHDCPPLFISAAEGMCPYISVSLVQSAAVRRKYFSPPVHIYMPKRELR